MSYAFEEVAGRRVCCGRCRHQVSQKRYEDGPFDSDTGLTFYCEDCHAVYAVCRICAWYMSDGKTCASDHSHVALVLGHEIVPRDRAAEKLLAEGAPHE